MSNLSDLETRQEARFVLWALRTAHCGMQGEPGAGMELLRGFSLAGVAGSMGAFQDFVRALFAMQWPLTVWHGPQCGCVSTEEVFVLNALAEAAARQRDGNAGAAQWWRLLLPARRIGAVDAAARVWLSQLELAGVAFPGPQQLHSCMRPLEYIAGPARHAAH